MPAPYFAQPRQEGDKVIVEAVYRVASEGRLKERLQMVLLSLEGHRVSFIAQVVHRDVDTVLQWLRRWNQEGFAGLHDRPYSGRPPILTQPQEEQMLAWVTAQVASGQRLTCGQVARWVQEQWGKALDEDSVRRLLHKHKCSWQKAGTRHHRADPQAQAQFREQLQQRMQAEPTTRFFFADEAIFQGATTTTYTWSPQGHRPQVPTNLSHQKIIEMGAVEPLTGANFHLLVSNTTQAPYRVFLQEFAKAFPHDKIVLLQDGASWHKVPSPTERIELWTLPPYSPELNPIEHLWKWIRENFTHNKFFETMAQLEQALIACLKDEETLRQAILSVCTIH